MSGTVAACILLLSMLFGLGDSLPPRNQYQKTEEMVEGCPLCFKDTSQSYKVCGDDDYEYFLYQSECLLDCDKKWRTTLRKVAMYLCRSQYNPYYFDSNYKYYGKNIGGNAATDQYPYPKQPFYNNGKYQPYNGCNYPYYTEANWGPNSRCRWK